MSDPLSCERVMEVKNKRYGDRTIRRADGLPQVRPRLQTGIFPLTFAVGGGYPIGVMTRLKGPFSGGKTTAAIYAMKMAHMTCWRCLRIKKFCKCSQGSLNMKSVYLDIEGKLDLEYVDKIGVPRDEFYLPIASDGGEYLDILETFLSADDLGLGIIDSVAMLLPKAETERAIGDRQVGALPKLMTDAAAKLGTRLRTEFRREHPCMILAINQMRYDPNARYGCFHGNTSVALANGATMPISKIVKGRLPLEVMTLDERTGQMKVSRIIDWHDNGPVEFRSDFIHFETDSPENGGRNGFCCTPRHQLMTPEGWMEAKYLGEGNNLMSWIDFDLCEPELQVIYGSLLGDGYFSNDSKHTAALKLQNSKQPEYLNWKIRQLAGIHFKQTTANSERGQTRFVSDYRQDLGFIRNTVKDGVSCVSKLTTLGLAVWYMDDGTLKKSHGSASISIKRFGPQEAELVTNALCRQFGLKAHYSKSQRAIVFTVSESHRLFNLIAPYIYPSMQYKLTPKYRGKFVGVFRMQRNPKRILIPVTIRERRIASNKQMREPHRYDITVEGEHNYVVGGFCGIVAHNSPETEGGGEAFKHASLLGIRVNKLTTKGVEDKYVGRKAAVADGTEQESKIQNIGRFGFILDKWQLWHLAKEGEYIKANEDILDKKGNVKVKATKILDHKIVMEYASRYGLVVQTKEGYKIPGLIKPVPTKAELIDAIQADEDAYYQLQKEIVIQAKKQHAGG